MTPLKPGPAPKPPRDPRESLALLVLGITLLVPIAWGADGQYAWDNSIVPTEVLRAMANGFSPSQLLTYGPLPYYLFAIAMAIVLVPMNVLGELGRPIATYPWGFQHPELAMTLIVSAAHLVTLGLAMGVAVLALRRARDDGDGWLAPLLLLGSPVFAFYGRTSNVDMHYLFWSWLAIYLAERASSVGRLCWAGVAAALAVCCKEQVAPISLVATVYAAWRALRLSGAGVRGVLAALSVPAAAALAYAVAWRLPFALASWQSHHEFIFSVAKYPRAFPASPAGFLALARQCLTELPEVLGLPVLLGIALAIGLRASWRGLGVRIAACALYTVVFLGAIGYVYERFLLPLLLVGLPLATRGYRTAFQAWAARPARRRALAVAIVALALSGGPVMSWVMLNDPRYEVERWLRVHVPPDATIEVAGNPHYQARVPRSLHVVYSRVDSLHVRPHGPIGDVVLTSSVDRYVYERDPVVREKWLAPVLDAGRYTHLAFPREKTMPFWDYEIPNVDVYVRRAGPVTAASRRSPP